MTFFNDPFKPDSLIDGVRIRKLQVNKDNRGDLVETLKTSWEGFFDANTLPFAQCYFSRTHAGIARDEDKWHIHGHQIDRFAVIDGDIVLGMYDNRTNSPTKGRLNLLRMGESNNDDGQYTAMIPIGVLHGFVTGLDKTAILTNFPTQLWDPSDEGRVAFDDVEARMPNGELFSWDLVREQLRKA